MISIRKLRNEDMVQAVLLKIQCWPEEMAGFSKIQLNFQKEIKSGLLQT